MSDFKSKLNSLMDSASSLVLDKPDFRQSASSFMASQIGGASESLEVSAVLERYSDRLVEIVSDKVSKQMRLRKGDEEGN